MKKLALSVFVFFLLSSPVHGLEIGKVDMPDSISAGQSILNLNGAGIRTKFFLKLYVGGLYLAEKNQNPVEIIDADASMAIKLHIISSMITSKKMENATREGFENSTNGTISPIQEEIEKFIAVFKEEIKENDVYDLVYTSENGTEIFKNNTLHSTIKGLPFKQALFGIWLCDKPAQKSLKKAMLGK